MSSWLEGVIAPWAGRQEAKGHHEHGATRLPNWAVETDPLTLGSERTRGLAARGSSEADQAGVVYPTKTGCDGQ